MSACFEPCSDKSRGEYLCSVVDTLKEAEMKFRRLMKEYPFYRNPYLNPKNDSFNRKDYLNNRKIVEERAKELEEAGLSAKVGDKTITVYFDDERYMKHNSILLGRREHEKLDELNCADIEDKNYYKKIYDFFCLLEDNPSHGPEHHKDTSAMALTAFDTINYLDSSVSREDLSDAMLDGWLLHDIGRGAARRTLSRRSNHAKPGKNIYKKFSEQLIRKGMTTEKKAEMTGLIIERHNMPYESIYKIKDNGLRTALSSGRFADKRIGILGTLKVLEFAIENSQIQDLPDVVPQKMNERMRAMEHFLEVQDHYVDLSKRLYERTERFELELIERFRGIRA